MTISVSDTLEGVVGPGTYDHAGIVVRDFEAGMEQLSASLGVTWGTPREVRTRVLFEDGLRNIEIRFVFSTALPVYELISAIDGTIFDPVGPGMLHHLAYFSDNVPAASRRLSGMGFPRVLTTGVGNDGDDSRTSLVVHRSTFGPYIELIGYRPTELNYPRAD
jgi:Glyoxalase/Bleomycin resistance protein/Dioxygenase superfamily